MIDQLRTIVNHHARAQFAFLREMVLQSSYSRQKQDVDKVGALITREFADLPLTRETVQSQETGDHLLFRSPACREGVPSILLVGHMDTVFPSESGFLCYHDDGEKVCGPGVIDMKGGLAVMVYAVKALHHLGLLERIPITLLFNADEEIGSPSSHDLIVAEGCRALCGLVFECGGLSGEIVTGRKGRGGFTLQVQGRAGHAAFAGKEKGSAILALAHKIVEIENLNDPEMHLVVNVGTVKGGIGPNTVAEYAMAEIDTRYLRCEDGEHCEAVLKRIAAHCHQPNTIGTLNWSSGRKPMVQTAGNRWLFHQVRESAAKLGIEVTEEVRSGVSDANTLSECGLAVIDGMGPVGDCDHSDREYMIKKSLPEKTLLTASTLVSLGVWRERDAHHRLPFQIPPTEVCLPSAL